MDGACAPAVLGTEGRFWLKDSKRYVFNSSHFEKDHYLTNYDTPPLVALGLLLTNFVIVERSWLFGARQRHPGSEELASAAGEALAPTLV
jgi:hypothetical protein